MPRGTICLGARYVRRVAFWLRSSSRWSCSFAVAIRPSSSLVSVLWSVVVLGICSRQNETRVSCRERNDCRRVPLFIIGFYIDHEACYNCWATIVALLLRIVLWCGVSTSRPWVLHIVAKRTFHHLMIWSCHSPLTAWFLFCRWYTRLLSTAFLVSA